MMMKRVPTRERRVASSVEEALDEFPREQLWRLAADEGRFAEASRFVRGWPEELSRLKRELLLRGMVEPSPAVTAAVASMTWDFLISSAELGFMTTDNPVIWPETIGLGGPRSFLFFPISTEVALFADRNEGEDCGFNEAPVDRVRMLNRAILERAERYGYFSRAEQWPLELRRTT